ncbi:MAG: cytochrome c, partial [Gemmatimonadaceae bacterium]|nr:cytochrome c [Chitinophagaceae bacterium]
LNLGQEVSLSGGVKFDLPLGQLYSKNITSDPETGIGKFTDAEIARSLRYGVHPNGTVVYDFMQFHNTSDEDLTAIISYLRTQKPVKNKVPEHSLTVLGNVVKAFVVKPAGPVGEVPKAVKIDTIAEYGRYMALSIGECSGCHTARDMGGNFIGEPFGGGTPMVEHGISFPPPNLTPDSTSRIFGWSQQNFIDRFKKGRLIPGSPMPWNSYKRMTDDELKAIYKFLKTTKPVKNKVPPPDLTKKV